MITITDRKILSYLMSDADDVRKLFYELREKDRKSEVAYYSGKRRTKVRLLSELRHAGHSGYTVAYRGREPGIKKLVELGLLVELGSSVEIHEPDAGSDNITLYILTDLGRDVYRYNLAVSQIERDDDNALREIGVGGRRALVKIRENGGLLPKSEAMLEKLYYAGLLERLGRGRKRLSPRRAKQLKYEPLDRDKLGATARFRRVIDRISQTGAYKQNLQPWE